MTIEKKRIAINTGGTYVPGLNAVAAGVTMAAHELGWETFGIRDGYEGLLFREHYPDRGLLKLTPDVVNGYIDGTSPLLGASQVNPFAVRKVKDMDGIDAIEEIDRSADLLKAIREERIDGVISIVGRRTLSLVWKLEKLGLPVVCVPKAVQNDVAATSLSFGFNSALTYAVETLDRIRSGARAVGKVAVVEVLGDFAGWLALQSGLAAGADAVLIPEIPYDLTKVAAQATRRSRKAALVVVAEGAKPANQMVKGSAGEMEALRRALSPGSEEGDSRRIIERSGAAGAAVTLELQRRFNSEALSINLSPLLRGGTPTPTDRQLGLAYGAAAVHGLREGRHGTMVAFQPPKIEYVPLGKAINKIRTVPSDSEFIVAARAVGIALGD